MLVRGEPVLASDQGVYLSVAARMLDGDHLYAQMIENKDPLFFYTYAAALWIGGWRGPFLLDGLWFALAAMGFALFMRELRAPRSAVVASFFVYPLALSSGWYLAGRVDARRARRCPVRAVALAPRAIRGVRSGCSPSCCSSSSISSASRLPRSRRWRSSAIRQVVACALSPAPSPGS